MSHALVVDDSKTSSAMLGKMLRKHDIDAVNVDSAEQALEYLQTERPSLIFMDHMMPGMDGFDAVKAIKAEPALAEIPIIMHTSKSGDIYVGHARALGAADILNKPATDKALSEVLNRLEERAQFALDVPEVVTTEAVAPDAYQNVPYSDREEELTASSSYQIEPVPAEGAPWRFISGVLACAVVVLAVMSFSSSQKLSGFKDRQSEFQDIVAWAASQAAAYEYGELPLAGSRLRLVEGLVTRLVAIGFKGELLVQGHIGAFCLTDMPLETGEQVTLLASADTPLSACDQVGYSAGQAALASRQQSEAFSRFINSSPLLIGSGLQLKVQGLGSDQPRYPYPTDNGVLSAGDWNAAALLNNRIEFKIKAH